MMLEMGEIFIINQYINWLDNSFVNHTDDSIGVIKTPYKRPDGDFVNLRLLKLGNKYYLTDNGETYDYLYISGIDLHSSSTNRDNLVRRTLLSNGVSFLNDIELSIEIKSTEEIGPAVSRLIRAITGLQYLIYTTRPGGIRYFRENVANYFTSKRINFEADYYVTGKAREHRFDFYIPGKLYLVKTLSTENIAWAKRLATETMFEFVDTKEVTPDYKGIALIDDNKIEVWQGAALSILKAYSDYVIPWKKRDDLMSLIS